MLCDTAGCITGLFTEIVQEIITAADRIVIDFVLHSQSIRIIDKPIQRTVSTGNHQYSIGR